MNRIFILGAFLIAMVMVGCSSDDKLGSIPEKEDKNSILWRIEKDGNVSYLMGTYHIMCKDDMVYDDLLKDLVEGSEVVVTESDPADQELPKIGNGILNFPIEENYKLKNIYSRSELSQFKDYIASLGLEPAFELLINTDIVSAELIIASVCTVYDCKSTTGSETYITSILNGKDELYLEENKEVKPIFRKMVNHVYRESDYNVLDMTDWLDYIDEIFKDEKMDDSYYNNDMQAMFDYIDDERKKSDYHDAGFSGMIKYLIKERNRLWVPRMIDIMNKSKALFAVGALHVFDLVERLEKEGYTLTPLDISDYK